MDSAEKMVETIVKLLARMSADIFGLTVRVARLEGATEEEARARGEAALARYNAIMHFSDEDLEQLGEGATRHDPSPEPEDV